MGSLKDLRPPLLSSSVAKSSSVPLETHGACSPPFSCFWPEAPCRGRCAVLDGVYILHHSQLRAERRVRGPGGLGAEFSRDPGPGERGMVKEMLGWGGPTGLSPRCLLSLQPLRVSVIRTLWHLGSLCCSYLFWVSISPRSSPFPFCWLLWILGIRFFFFLVKNPVTISSSPLLGTPETSGLLMFA